MNCDDVREKFAGGAGLLRPEDGEIVDHLLECKACRSLWLAGGLLEESLGSAAGSPSSGAACPEGPRLAALVDGTLAGEERSAAVRHVADCPQCVRSMAASYGAGVDSLPVDSVHPPPELKRRAIELVPEVQAAGGVPWTTGWFVGLSAAAGLVLGLIGFGLLTRNAPGITVDSGAVLRGSGTVAVGPVVPQGPVPAQAPLEFRWNAAGPTGSAPASYRLLVLEVESGDTILERIVEGVAYVPDRGELARIRPGVRYHWLVEPVGFAGADPSMAVAFWLDR